MTVFSGLAQAGAARDAGRIGAEAGAYGAQLQYNAAQQGMAEQRRQYDQSREDMQPWLTSGRAALGELDRASTGDMSDFYRSPDYEFTRSEGQRDIGSSFAARGGAASGNALKALSEFNRNRASSQFGDWWNRTAARAGVGQSAAGNLGAMGQNTANAISGIATGAARGMSDSSQYGANARASGVRQAGDAYANSIQNGARIFSYFYGMGG